MNKDEEWRERRGEEIVQRQLRRRVFILFPACCCTEVRISRAGVIDLATTLDFKLWEHGSSSPLHVSLVFPLVADDIETLIMANCSMLNGFSHIANDIPLVSVTMFPQ